MITRGIQLNPVKIWSIRNAKILENAKEIKIILGYINFLRKCYITCSTIIISPTSLLRKHAKYKVIEECHEAFELIEKLMSEVTLLAAIRDEGYFVITCNALDFGMGAVLMREQDEEFVILEFTFRILRSLKET